ncbi:MAG: respiratory nitrate reductase subunit gamma [Myxococcales bacterium]|jgi:nitrate reductase gamma subunit
MIDGLLFGVLPYLSLAALIAVPLVGRLGALRPRVPPYRFVAHRGPGFAATALAAGGIGVAAGHLFALAFPSAILAAAPSPLLLLALETASLVAGLLLALGVAGLAWWTWKEPRVRAVALLADRIVFALLALEVATGIGTALAHRWGAVWGAAVVVPYVRSVFTGAPEPELPGSLPVLVQAHLAGAWLLMVALPFSARGRFRRGHRR